jgi:hypothetical protein
MCRWYVRDRVARTAEIGTTRVLRFFMTEYRQKNLVAHYFVALRKMALTVRVSTARAIFLARLVLHPISAVR